MDNACLPISDFIAFLDMLEHYIISAERILDYVIVDFGTHTHAYEEIYGEVCHVIGFDNTTGETFVAPKGKGT